MNRLRTVLLVVGLSVLFLYYKNSFVFRYVYSSHADTTCTVALFAFCASAAFLCLLLLFRKKLAEKVVSPLPFLLICACATIGTFLMFEFSSSFPIVCVSSIFIAAFFVLATCIWVTAFTNMPTKVLCSSTIIGFAGSFLLSTLLRAALPIGGEIVVSILPVICGVLWCSFALTDKSVGRAVGKGTVWQTSYLKEMNQTTSQAVDFDNPSTCASVSIIPSSGFAGLLIALYLTSSLVRNFSIVKAYDSFTLDPNLALTIASIALLMIFLLLLLRLQPLFFCYISWLCTFVCILLGLFLLQLPGDDLLMWGSDLVALGLLSIIPLLYILAILRREESSDEAYQVRPFILLVLLPNIASVTLRDLISPSLAAILPLYAATVTACCFILVTVTIVFITFVLVKQILQNHTLSTASTITSGVSAESIKEPDVEMAVAALSDRYGLTKKESETCILLAKGYTMQSVADNLCVSLNTVRSHSRAIYSKIGIHTKQELIEVVEQAVLKDAISV